MDVVNSTEVAGLRIFKALVWIVYAIATVASIILAFAFFLLLFDASTKAPFVTFIYDWSARFAYPFTGMIAATKLGAGHVLSWSLIFAIAAYMVIAWLVGMVLGSISTSIYRRSRGTAAPAAAAQAPAEAPQVSEPAAAAKAPSEPPAQKH